MFSGIVQATGTVRKIEQGDQAAVVTLCSPLFAATADGVKTGASVSVSGVCLTVVESGGDCARFDVVSETLRCTTLGELTAGSRVNLELALRVGDRLDGHIVQGHVDAVASLRSHTFQGETLRFEFSLPRELSAFVVPKGSIAVDGVSLTVGEIGDEFFSVYIIPHTAQATTLGSLETGSRANIEADCIAKYLSRISQSYLAAGGVK